MLTAFVLVCSLAVTPEIRDCGRDNAVGVLRLPEEVALPSGCLKLGSAYLAQTVLGRNLSEDERVKVLCVPSHKLRRMEAAAR
jgi:hypothetical protein